MSPHPVPLENPTNLADDTADRGRRGLIRTLALAGPAFVVGAWQFGPGNLTTAVQAGSSYGYALIWVIAVSTVLMLFYTDMGTRLGMATPVSLIGSARDVFGRPVGIAAGLGVFFITLMFSIGNAVGSGLGLSMIFGGPPILWTVVCTAAVALILLFRNVYGAVEKILLVIVAVMGLTFVASAFIAQPDWYRALAGVVPSVPANAELLIIALVGTNFSINAAFFTAYGGHERKRTRAEYRRATIVDTIPGIIAPGIMTALVIVVAAAVLGRTGEEAAGLPQLAAIFEPIAGPVGSLIFAIGFFGAAFSSMIANATAGGTMLSDALGAGPSPSTRAARITSLVILIWGVLIALTFRGAPIQLIVVAQALTVLVAPLLAFLMLALCNNRRLMGELRNNMVQNIFGALGFLSILSLSGLLIHGFLT